MAVCEGSAAARPSRAAWHPVDQRLSAAGQVLSIHTLWEPCAPENEVACQPSKIRLRAPPALPPSFPYPPTSLFYAPPIHQPTNPTIRASPGSLGPFPYSACASLRWIALLCTIPPLPTYSRQLQPPQNRWFRLTPRSKMNFIAGA